jgi:hypothetical protein
VVQMKKKVEYGCSRPTTRTSGSNDFRLPAAQCRDPLRPMNIVNDSATFWHTSCHVMRSVSMVINVHRFWFLQLKPSPTRPIVCHVVQRKFFGHNDYMNGIFCTYLVCIKRGVGVSSVSMCLSFNKIYFRCLTSMDFKHFGALYFPR